MTSIQDKILTLKKEKNAIILAHYYQRSEIQDIADYVGDSYGLALQARDTQADIIIFCGVHFMAETAKILAPSKKVLLPVAEAGCPLANMITEKQLITYKNAHPHTKILAYMNSTAAIKALSDVCVTSSNAEKIIHYYASQGFDMLYLPDQNLANYVKHKSGINIEAWKGFCCVHHDLQKTDVIEKQRQYPNAVTIIHPEARLEVLQLADFVGSTSQMVDYAKKAAEDTILVGTEEGILHRLALDSPNKQFILLSDKMRCYDMKLTTLHDVFSALKHETHEIDVDNIVAEKARLGLNQMIQLTEAKE